MVVNSVWLQGYLGAIGYHSPRDFPKTPEELLPKKEPEQKLTTPKQWAALFSHALGRPVKFDEPRIKAPTSDEVKRYG